MAINVSLPVEAPTGITTTLVSGGSLAESTTYYYVMVAMNTDDATPWYADIPYHSPISEEGSFTTNTTGRSVTFNWSNVSGAARYNILLTTTSGDYTNSGMYTDSAESYGTITDGVAGYTITALSSNNYVHHSIQLVNPFIGNVDKSLGILRVHLDGTDTIDLDDVYNAIVASGYSGYCAYDGYNFIFKGYFETFLGDTDAGTLAITQKNLVFLRGGVNARSQYYTIRFGSWVSDLQQAAYGDGCHVDIQNCRYPFQSPYDGLLQFYGGRITNAQTQITTETENLSKTYYTGGGQMYLNQKIDEFKDTQISLALRGVTSQVKDLKVGASNNWGNEEHIRLKVLTTPNMPYRAGGTFYACEFLTYSDTIRSYTFDLDPDYTNFYDCEFPNYPDDRIGKSNVQFTHLTVTYGYQTNNYLTFNNSIRFLVADSQGNVLSGATVSAVDASGNSAIFIEHDGTEDRLVTGTEYTGSTTTDASGYIDYYFKTRHFTQIAGYSGTSDTVTGDDLDMIQYYPYTFTVSMEGYADNVFVLGDLNARTTGTVVMSPPTPQTGGTKIFDGAVFYAGTQIF